jgi:pantoate--beta-alanine ligase
MYSRDEQGLNLDLGNLDTVMEGEFRPGHFKGVITIVHKLFNIIKPTSVYLGEKDFQQLAVIRFMALKLHSGIKIIGCPTVREQDGLAMSSRNLRLTKEEREAVGIIYKSLLDTTQWKSLYTVQQVKDKVINQINSVHPFKVEYFDIVDSTTLQPISRWSDSDNPRACIAVLTSTVRLIDNIAL